MLPQNKTYKGLNCSAGRYQPDTASAACLPCVPGKFKSDAGTTECVDCAVNTFSKLPGSSSCENCGVGEKSEEGSANCLNCDAGEAGTGTDGACELCIKGRYRQSKKDDEWKFTITAQDITASAGITVTQTILGDVVSGKLKTALTGADTTSMVVTGSTGGSFISTTDIVIGTGNTATTVAHTTITTVANTPTDPTTCVDCPAGWSSEVGSTKCQSCEAGSFSNEKGKECTACIKGHYRQSKKDDEWTFTITTQDITANAGVTVTQTILGDVVTGTLRTALTGTGTKTIVVAATTGGSFVATTDIVIGNGDGTALAIAHSTITNARKITPTDPTTCVGCPKGYYTDDVGQASCLPCIPGQFNDATGAVICKDCRINSYSTSKNRQVPCDACAEGRSSKPGSTKCSDCTPGKFVKEVDNQEVCEMCPTGYEQSEADKKNCSICEIGYESKVGASSCDKCGEGSYGSEAKVCTDCPAGYYQDIRGELNCVACPFDTYLTETGKKSKAECTSCSDPKIDMPHTSTDGLDARISSASCICSGANPTDKKNPDGFYTNALGRCVECPNGADCSTKSGLALAELTAKPGYWRPDLTTDTFSPCVVGYSSLDAQELADARCCPVNITTNTSICSNTTFKNTNEQCKKEYAGTLCLVCAEGYVKQGTTCIECEGGASISIAALPLIGLLLGLFFLLVIFLICGKKAEKTAESGNKWFGQVKIILSFLQIFSSMPGVLDGVPWPKPFLQFSLPLNIFNMDFLAILAKSGCSLNVRFYDKFILHMMLPVGCLLVIGMAYFIAKTCCVKKDDTQKQENMKETASKAVILIILLIFPGLATKIFTIFKCKTIEGIPGSLLVEDYDQRCYEGEHFTYMIVGGIFLCLYVLGIPLIMFLLLWRNKKHLHDEKSPKHHLIKKALGGMYTQYEPAYWWFEIFLLINKTMMCGGLVMAAPGTPLQVLIAMLIMLVHLLVVLKLAPYESNGEDASSLISSLTLTLTTIGGMVIMMENRDAPNSEFLANILIAISVTCIASQIGITIFVDCGVWEKICTKKNSLPETTKIVPLQNDGEEGINARAKNAWD